MDAFYLFGIQFQVIEKHFFSSLKSQKTDWSLLRCSGGKYDRVIRSLFKTASWYPCQRLHIETDKSLYN